MPGRTYKSPLAIWFPLGLRRIDLYYIRFYLKTFLLILIGLIVLISIGDIFQRYEDLAAIAQRDGLDTTGTIGIFAGYYVSFAPPIILQYMMPLTMLLAAAITVTASYCGPRGNNEYTVTRAAGVPIFRSFLPLILSALGLSVVFQAGRDYFLPDLIRRHHVLQNRIRSRIGIPVGISLMGKGWFETAAIGNFLPGGMARNVLLEFRDTSSFRRGDHDRGDNDFIAYRAPAAILEKGGDGGWRWLPVEGGEIHEYTRFFRRSRPWTEPVPTSMTPAIIERQIIGDAVTSWTDLFFLRDSNPVAAFELQWRLAEPLACCLLVILGSGFWMGCMVRSLAIGYVPAIGVSMGMAAIFYIFRVIGRTMWENGMLSPEYGVWLPLAAAGIVAAGIIWRLEF
ncbi:MAG: LptF/LptG family permease [Planctomycetota bacterium]|jgi:lipopolysaccharide export LptBFGC system permease protein LptF|nr:LptF/LptG family permease [Planctomycetota bacterium]